MNNRAVILTTHSLEECEALCSRMGIMAQGSLRCIGSAQHLRERFGSGYHLDVNLPLSKHQSLDDFVQSALPGSQMIECVNNSLKFSIPGNHKLSQIFALVEEHKSSLEIQEYALGETTLEQIFISFARKYH